MRKQGRVRCCDKNHNFSWSRTNSISSFFHCPFSHFFSFSSIYFVSANKWYITVYVMILPAVVNVSIWGFVLMSVECLKHSLNVPNVIWHQKSSSTCVTTAWSSLLLLLLLMTLSLGSGGRRRFHTQFTQVFFTAGNSLYCSQIRADSSASNLRHVWALQQLEPDFSSTIKFFTVIFWFLGW